MQNTQAPSPILSVKDIQKAFGGVRALEGVSVDFYPGEVHCVVGENGAGKSTLMKIISGILKRNAGEITYFGKSVEPKSMWDMSRQGIGMILQEPGLIGSLTVAENLFLNREEMFSTLGVLQKGKRNRAAAEALERIGVDSIDVTKRMTTLPYGQWKLIELARALSHEALKVLVIDEATAALSIDGQEILFKQIAQLKRRGIAVMFVSHRLKEVFDIGDRITVMKDAKVVDTILPGDTSLTELPKMMVGRDIEHYYRDDKEESYDSEVLLSVRNIGVKQVKDVSLDLHRGEILGIGGLVGSGMHDLGRALFSSVSHKGEIYIRGDKVRIANPVNAIKLGIGYIPRERDKEGLVPMHSIKDNIALPNLHKIMSKFMKKLFISRRLKKMLAEKFKTILQIKAPTVDVSCLSLSGGNRQKVVLAKWLARDVEIFILACPTRGVDVGAKAQIYRLMEELKHQGKGVVMISEELPELIGMSDNIIIFKRGHVAKTFKRSDQPSEEEIVMSMV